MIASTEPSHNTITSELARAPLKIHKFSLNRRKKKFDLYLIILKKIISGQIKSVQQFDPTINQKFHCLRWRAKALLPMKSLAKLRMHIMLQCDCTDSID